jgi:hypothetical protein
MDEGKELYRMIRSSSVAWRDTIVGLALADEIARADRIVFQNRAVPVNILTSTHDFDVPAQYTKDIDRDPQEAYEIYLPNLSTVVRSETLYPRLDLRATIRSIVLHEVRHRMQYNFADLRLFRPDSKVDDPDWRFLIGNASELFEERRRNGNDAHITHYLDREFDAVVIGSFAVWEKPDSDEDIRQLLSAQPQP